MVLFSSTIKDASGSSKHLTTANYVTDIVNHPAFKGFGELLLPRDNNSGYYNTQLRNVGSLMPYHKHVEPDVVVGALNHMIDEVDNGETIFYDFYTIEQKQRDPRKENTGLFFFRGNPDAPFAIICPGGGFSYVGSLHEGFPLAQRISESGLNAFVIRYRIGSGQWATEDLAAAIAYTGQSSYSSDFPPTFVTVAANDGIVNVNTVDRRVENLRNAGVDVEYHRYRNAGHGFGLGTDTDAEGWVDLAVQFWRRHLSD